MAVKGKAKSKAQTRLCSNPACRRSHQSGLPGTYVVPALLDPTEYLCSKECYDAWCAAHPCPKSIKDPRVAVDDDEMSVARDPGTPLFEV